MSIGKKGQKRQWIGRWANKERYFFQLREVNFKSIQSIAHHLSHFSPNTRRKKWREDSNNNYHVGLFSPCSQKKNTNTNTNSNNDRKKKKRGQTRVWVRWRDTRKDQVRSSTLSHPIHPILSLFFLALTPYSRVRVSFGAMDGWMRSSCLVHTSADNLVPRCRHLLRWISCYELLEELL